MSTPGKIVINSKTGCTFTITLDVEDHERLFLAGKLNGLYASKKGQHYYVQNINKEYLHRLIMNPPAEKVVDHINRDTLDNRRVNLRVVTIGDNVRNARRKGNTTGKTGTRPYRDGVRFEAYIFEDNRKSHLGIFKTLELAIEARQQAELRVYGKVYEH